MTSTSSFADLGVPARLISNLSAVSRAFYLALHQPRFTKGWLNRVASVNRNALAMVASPMKLA